MPHASASRIAPHTGISSSPKSRTPSISVTPADSAALTSRVWILVRVIGSPIGVACELSIRLTADTVTKQPSGVRTRYNPYCSRIGLNGRGCVHIVIAPIVSARALHFRRRCIVAKRRGDTRYRKAESRMDTIRTRGEGGAESVHALEILPAISTAEYQPIRRALHCARAERRRSHEGSRRRTVSNA
jgi:hypothetical protein